ncbi:Nca2p [Ascoidea rubescens DSM 1968]|uniref:NCA2-domain-containing protein n=1 Tax=Ascoidea rubescens DSM 1968 TaxID=1344418 RepID=A0A1D2VGI9_9ASCO|nr:NCA2-domain-containing protein [Ascoidea rubescens DSM 1968]ODV60587.1 NCA2-domain-containing protein [Ascoidea rubescens DSM 1968]
MDYSNFILKYPIILNDSIVSSKIKKLNNLNNLNAQKLGSLLIEFPNFINNNNNISNYNNSNNSSIALNDSNESIDIEQSIDPISFNNYSSLIKFQSILSNNFNINFNLTKSNKENPFSENDEIFNKLNIIFFNNLPNYNKNINKFLVKNSKPKFLTRYWILILILLKVGPNQFVNLFHNYPLIISWIKVNLIDSLIGIYHSWLLKPLQNIFNTIKHDDNSMIALVSNKSLESDLESLERMVSEFIQDEKLTPKYNNYNSINNSSQDVDLSLVMKSYENELKQPIKNLLVGNLLRNILIQIQKLKTDGLIAANGIDKLIKSQELVFYLIAGSPSFLILLWLLQNFKLYLKKGYVNVFQINFSKYKLRTLQNLNNIERLLIISLNELDNNKNSGGSGNNNGDVYFIEGMLLLEILSLKKNGLNLLSNDRKNEWLRDIEDLSNQNLKVELRLKVINKIYNVYRSYLY